MSRRRLVLAGLLAPSLLLAVLTGIAWLSLSYQRGQLARMVERSTEATITAEVELVAALAGASSKVDLATWNRARFPHRRVTVIASDGSVLFDSEADPAAMDNHNSRPEVQQARRGGIGISRRPSDTVGRSLLYAAKDLGDGRVIRVAAPIAVESTAVHDLFSRTASASLVVAGAAALMVLLLVMRDRARLRELQAVSRAYAAGDFAYRANLTGGGAFARLGHELNHLGERLQATLDELAYQRSLLDNALGALTEGVACIDRLDRVVYANPAYRQFAAGGAEVQGQLFYEHIPAAVVAEPLGSARSDSDGPEHAYAAEFEHRRRHLRAMALRIGNGIVVLVLHDLTEIRRTEQARRDFMASISHEFKTPLTSILGFTDTLLSVDDDIDPAMSKDFIGRIARHAQRLSGLVHDVLTLSRLEQAAWEVRPEPVDLTALCHAILDEYEPTALVKNVHLVYQGPERLEIVSDPELLRQLLGNLVSNAVRYNRTDGTVWLRLAIRSGGVVATIEDTGVGIPEDHHHRIFDRFHRVDAHRSRQSGGTGLGLAIVKQLVEVLGGDISFTSGAAGSAFTVDLPQGAQTAATLGPAPTSTPA
ncbi:MAG: hypothetical protein H0V44_17370 [Planctomycetes bacterium]|nr:hypothetical protein [Planctomycetota bacterium]